MKKAASFALGCKVNQYESEAIAELFAEKGYEIVGIDEEADVYVINTCTVTNFGDKKSRQLIRKVKRQNENAIVAVVGCYAQTAPKELMEIAGVNLVIGTKDRAQIVEMVEQYDRANGVENHVSDIMKERVFEPLSIQKLANRTRAYLKIQDGCSQYCSYCIIPYARGPIRSREPQEVVAEVKRLAENGFKEVVLTGIHVASYGKDRRDTSLLDILKQVHEVEGIERIRFSSIEPNVVTEEFAQTMAALPKVCDHFHLSLQSGCDKTLKEMNRKYGEISAGGSNATEISAEGCADNGYHCRLPRRNRGGFQGKLCLCGGNRLCEDSCIPLFAQARHTCGGKKGSAAECGEIREKPYAHSAERQDGGRLSGGCRWDGCGGAV